MVFTTSPSYHGYLFTSETPLLQRRTSIDGHIASKMLRTGKLLAIKAFANEVEYLKLLSIKYNLMFFLFFLLHLPAEDNAVQVQTTTQPALTMML